MSTGDGGNREGYQFTTGFVTLSHKIDWAPYFIAVRRKLRLREMNPEPMFGLRVKRETLRMPTIPPRKWFSLKPEP
jgi:hypothetical protein